MQSFAIFCKLLQVLWYLVSRLRGRAFHSTGNYTQCFVRQTVHNVKSLFACRAEQVCDDVGTCAIMLAPQTVILFPFYAGNTLELEARPEVSLAYFTDK